MYEHLYARSAVDTVGHLPEEASTMMKFVQSSYSSLLARQWEIFKESESDTTSKDKVQIVFPAGPKPSVTGHNEGKYGSYDDEEQVRMLSVFEKKQEEQRTNR